MTTNPQQEFDAKYISSAEIIRELGINRTTLLYHRAKGNLPDPIVVNNNMVHLYLRDQIAPYLAAWKQTLDFKRHGV